MISICVPAYDSGPSKIPMLEELVESIKAQEFGEYFEIVVSDECFDVDQYWHHSERGILLTYVAGKPGAAANLNNAIAHARGDIIKPMFQDDKFMDPDSLQKIVETFEQGAEWIACISHNEGIENYDHLPYEPPSIEALREGCNTYGCPSAMAWRKNDLGFDENLKWLFDCEFYGRMQERYGEPSYVPTPIFIRQWEGQATRAVADGQQRILDQNEVIEKYRDRGGAIKA